MDFAPPRGTQDFLPPSGARLRALYGRAGDLAEVHGYRYVETPIFDHTDVFARSSGATSDVVSKEMYTFEDRGGRSLTLRPEGTAAVMRAYLGRMHAFPSPFKAYYLERMYRYGRPQAGRYREHRQFGLEVFGAAEPAADVEVIAVGNAFLTGLGLRSFELQLNSIGDAACRPAYRDELVAYFEHRRDELTDEHRDRFRDNPLRVLDCKDPACRTVARDAPRITDRLCGPCREHFEAVQAGLDAEGIPYTLVPTLVRGLDYYTRTAFEFVSLALSQAQATLFGGGRYDGLAEVLGGPAVPGVGYGMGLERVLLAVEDEGGEVPAGPGLECFVVAVGEAAAGRARELARRLRGAGVSTEVPFGTRSLKAQLRMADRSGARHAAILGEKEAAAGTVTLKSLADGAQVEVTVEEAVRRLAGGAEEAR